jgi:hypothetical protein
MTKAQKKISKIIGDFIGSGVQKTSGFIIHKGFNLADTFVLSLLKQTAKNKRLTKALHSQSPQLSQLLTTLRKSSPAVSFMAGKVAGKAAVTGIRIGFEVLKISGKLFNMISKKLKKY